MKLGRRVASTAVPLALLLGASHASAQQRPGIDAQTWRPSTDPNASIVNEPAITPGAGVLTLGAWGQYNFHPIALKRPGTITATTSATGIPAPAASAADRVG